MTDPPRVRRIRADEWRAVRDLRFEAVRDPDATIAFLDTEESIAARDDDFWRERTVIGAESDRAAQFVAEVDGEWIGALTVLIRMPGAPDHLGRPIEHPRADVVGVYVRPACRGTGVVDVLLSTAIDWALAHGAPVITLDVHEENARAQAAYRRNGFRETGATTAGPTGVEITMAWVATSSEIHTSSGRHTGT